MARALSAWWLGPKMGSVGQAERILAKFRPLIEHTAVNQQFRYPGEVDWESIAWDAAYRASFRLDGADAGFPALFRTIFRNRAANFLSRHIRRRTKLIRLPASVLDDILSE